MVGLLGVAVWWYVEHEAHAAIEAINPASENNVINQGVEGIGSALSGEQGWTLGGWLYDITHESITSAAAITGTPPPADAHSRALPGAG